MHAGPTGASRDGIRQQFQKYRKQWDANARLDPLWAVLTIEGKLGDGWPDEEFFRTGEQEIDEVFRFREVHGLATTSIGRVLDFGCGVGRLTAPLSKRGACAVGVDISLEMIRRAREYFPDLAFHLNEKDDLSDFADGSFDLVYSNIVLQHLNADLQRHYIREFGRVVRKGGCAIFQVPGRKPRGSRALKSLKMLATLTPSRAFLLAKRVVKQRALPWQTGMEMNVLPKREVSDVARSSGLEVRAIGNIDWKTFYASYRFRLAPESEEFPDDREFPLSHLYFCEKVR